MPYEAAADIQELVQVEEVMTMQGVGPNGALVFCMEFLEANMSWLINKLKQFQKHYLIFDFPGQVHYFIDWPLRDFCVGENNHLRTGF